MKTVDEIREDFLSFFEKKHNSKRVKSSSLIPDNPTILLTTAGMVQFIPYFLGLEKFPYDPPRATSCQKCARAGGKDSDIENVGRTPRHHTFFEMLGNFSFGDYFKEEVIPWSWDFVTNYLKLDKNRLWITIYEDDDEAGEIWQKVGVPKERIIKKGKKDNFWGPVGTSGSCGPCSEIHYDLGEHLKCSDDCSIATCECNRWVEIWNLVFTELFQDEEGNLSPLEKKNVDTGMGLERIAMVCQGVDSTFETDLLKQILDKICEITGKKYKENPKNDISLRIITDHARCVSFMIADGILPSNEGRGYVLRMILRRALRHGYILGLELPFMKPIIDKVVDIYKDAYPELGQNRNKIQDVILKEEERFNLTLKRGWSHIEELIKKIKENNKNEISGEEAFKLYDTYGFPYELTKEIADENNLKVDEEGFKAHMQEQKDRARASVQKISLVDDLVYVDNPQTEFLGYEKNTCTSKVINIIENEDTLDVILDKTVFYAQSGGQEGDTGVFIKADGTKIEVLETFKVQDVFVHRVKKSDIKVSDEITAQIDVIKRQETQKHHSLAHLLQAALIKVLGDEVHQAGSQVEKNRTRYDFSLSRAMTKDEIKKVEEIINDWINQGVERKTEVMGIEEARLTGAMALFGEKYGETVRVVSFGTDECISKELCGGCHVDNTKDLRLAKIVSESAIAAGVRRIEILCSNAAFDFLNQKACAIDEIAQKNKIPYTQIEDKIEKIETQNRELNAKIEELEAKIAQSSFSTFISKAKNIEGGKLFITKIEDFAPNAIKAGVEMISKKLGECIIVLCSIKQDGSAFVIANVSDSFVKKGIQAGKIVGEITRKMGGGGGGRPQLAQGAGKDTSKADEILAEVEKNILSSL